MKRDFKFWIILLAFSLPVIAILFIGTFYFVNCGVNNDCARGDFSQVIHTPVPTLLPATLSAPTGSSSALSPAACSAPAATLLAAWVSAGSSESQSFTFTDSSGNSCTASFADLQPLFTASNLWYPGALSCTNCHNSSLSASAGGLDLSTYAGIQAGASGKDILGGGDWKTSLLDQALFFQKRMPVGAPLGNLTDIGPYIIAGVTTASLTPTPVSQSPDEVPEPSNPGAPGPAVNMTGDPAKGAILFKANCASCHGQSGQGGVPNPGSSDETVPPLNPIDPLLKNTDPKVFAQNIDLFIQHGSVPEGISPWRNMPGWGDNNALTQQQIADLIAYLISLNK